MGFGDGSGISWTICKYANKNRNIENTKQETTAAHKLSNGRANYRLRLGAKRCK